MRSRSPQPSPLALPSNRISGRAVGANSSHRAGRRCCTHRREPRSHRRRAGSCSPSLQSSRTRIPAAAARERAYLATVGHRCSRSSDCNHRTGPASAPAHSILAHSRYLRRAWPGERQCPRSAGSGHRHGRWPRGPGRRPERFQDSRCGVSYQLYRSYREGVRHDGPPAASGFTWFAWSPAAGGVPGERETISLRQRVHVPASARRGGDIRGRLLPTTSPAA